MPCKIVGGTKVPGNESSWERKFLGTKGPGNESSRERKVSVTKVLHRDYSFLGTKGLGHEKSQYHNHYACLYGQQKTATGKRFDKICATIIDIAIGISFQNAWLLEGISGISFNLLTIVVFFVVEFHIVHREAAYHAHSAGTFSSINRTLSRKLQNQF